MKVGIIRCQQTEDVCPGTTDFKIVREGKFAFERTGPSEVVAFVSCGGCPSKKAVFRAKQMAERGVEAIALASCICKGTPIGFPCPHTEHILSAVRRAVGDGVIVLDYTH